MKASRVVEEVFPFAHYRIRARRQRMRCEAADILAEDTFAGYRSLTPEQAAERLKQEHARAVALDDKTFKLTLSLTLGLTLAGSVAALLVKGVADPCIQAAAAALVGLSLFYVLSAGFIAIGALKTLPSYGFGTRFVLRQSSGTTEATADALARQEVMNTIRHLRNETAYQALRNGLILLFGSFLVFYGQLAFQNLCPRSPLP